MPTEGGILLDIEFDFLSHEVICRTSRAEIGRIALRPISVAQFFDEFFKTLTSLGVSVRIDPMPVEIMNPIRCDLDTVHCSYDEDEAAQIESGSLFRCVTKYGTVWGERITEKVIWHVVRKIRHAQ